MRVAHPLIVTVTLSLWLGACTAPTVRNPATLMPHPVAAEPEPATPKPRPTATVRPTPTPSPTPKPDFTGSDLDGRTFFAVDLSGVSFAGASIEGVTFENTILQGADFRGASLAGAQFMDEPNLVDADFTDAVLDDAEFWGGDAAGAIFDRASLNGGHFQDINLAGASFRDASLVGRGIYGGTDLTGADLSGANLEESDFAKVTAVGATFDGASFGRAEFSDSNFETASFVGATFESAVFETTATTSGPDPRNTLTGAVLTGATLDGTNFSGAVGVTDSMLADALGVPPEDLLAALAASRVLLESESTITDALVDACDGQVVAEAAPYDADGRFHPLVATVGDEELSTMIKSQGWRPPALRYAELVACAEPLEQVIVRDCGLYSGRSGLATVYLTVDRLTISVFEARSGELLAQREFDGVPRKRCPEEVTATIGATNVKLDGIEAPDHDKVVRFLGRLVGGDGATR